MRFMRLREVCKTFGAGGSTIYDLVRRGLLPPSVKVGERNGAWPSDEIDLIVAARLAGKTNDEVIELVRSMIDHRRGAFDRAVAAGSAACEVAA